LANFLSAEEEGAALLCHSHQTLFMPRIDELSLQVCNFQVTITLPLKEIFLLLTPSSLDSYQSFFCT
jgi:hypothetical protein